MAENAYSVAIPTHPKKVVTVNVNVNRLKKFRGRWSRPFPTEIPEGVSTRPGTDDEGPFSLEELPSTSFVDRVNIADEETAFSGVSNAVVEILAKRMKGREVQYLVLTATYETCWQPASALMPSYGPLVRAFDDAERRDQGWPALRRSARLAEANAAVDEDELLF
ncbi:hypothetical protein PI124_g14278 [Phytophthora idaei]|nr:hypothetical protein PI125_g16829 [Phytophthora idaei]KAG3145909.1 hypothetical protein PI126_g13534 [Phytophthora idaei]KAG3240832.1 hypothetical protein PI124_g14278 [Phytophthora idaei]